MARVTSKGQVTIPIAIREQLGITPGSEVEFEVENGAVLLRKKSGDIREWLERVERKRGRWRTTGMTTDEIMALTRGDD